MAIVMTNRRNFVKQAGAMIAMATMPGGIQSASERREKSLTLKRSRIKVDDQWDVIIVGGGPAGCTAAIAATREGAKRNGDSRNGSCLVSVFRW